MVLPWTLFLSHISNLTLTHSRGFGNSSKADLVANLTAATTADSTNFCWVFTCGFSVGFFLWVFHWIQFYWFLFGFGMVFLAGLDWLWIRFSGGFGLIFVWLDFELGFLMVWLILMLILGQFVVDYQLLKWITVVMVGWCWVSGWMFVFFFFAGLLWPLGKRGNLNGEREKKNKLLSYIVIVTVYICTIIVARVWIYTFFHPLMCVV